MNDYIELAESEELDEEDLSEPERAQVTAAKDLGKTLDSQFVIRTLSIQSDLFQIDSPVPPPKRLMLERQFHKSLLIGWLPPDCSRSFIDCYHIYVDGVLKVNVPSNERTKALIEGVDSSIVSLLISYHFHH